MDPKLGFDILVNGAKRTFRDRQDIAYEAARALKSIRQNELVEIVDRATGEKVMILADGRLA